MKNLKKWMAGLLAIVMLFALSGSVMAASITVTNPVANQTYKAYKIFDVTNDGTKSYSYTIDSNTNKWFGTVQTYAGTANSGLALNQIGDTKVYNVIATEGVFSAANFAAALNAAKAEKDVAGTGVLNGTTVEINVPDKGYYFVDSSLGALCVLDTTTSEVSVNEKNSKPTIEKAVKEDSTGVFGTNATADMGQEVEFKLTVDLGDGYTPEGGTNLGTGIDGEGNIVIVDTFPTGMSYVDGSISVTTIKGTWTENTDYTLSSNENEHTITLLAAKLANENLAPGSDIIVTYRASVGTEGDVGTVGNKNIAVLTYKGYEAEEASAVVYTYEIPVFKFYRTVSGENTTDTPLAGAVFALTREDGSSLKFEKVADTTLEKETYRHSANGNVDQITTDATGKFTLQGLDAGTYKLTEVTAPAGYNKLTEAITVVIAEDGTVTYKMKAADENAVVADANDGILVENKTGSILPSTGGMGTTIFYIVGAGLVLVAGVLLITRKRMSAEEK